MPLNALVISADELKKTIPSYDPSRADEFHKLSASMAEKEFVKALKFSSNKTVILMNGGSASGKTEFMVTQLMGRKAIIFDTTLPTVEGARIKISRAKKHSKKIEIYAVIPDNLFRSFIAFLHRDRLFPPDHFYHTHSESRKTLLWLAENYPDIRIHIIESNYTLGKSMDFIENIFPNRLEMIEFLKNIQITEDAIIKETIKEYE